MIIPPLSKPNRTPDNVTIFLEAVGAVTRRIVTIAAVLDTGTSVLCLCSVITGHQVSAYAILLPLCMI
jgi:hypothetical protein